jgi:hypothetical protein
MALIIYLKEQNKAIVVNGNGEALKLKIQSQLETKDWVLFRMTEGTDALVASKSISHIEEITEKELKRRKDAYEAEMKRNKQRQGIITNPNLIIPRHN